MSLIDAVMPDVVESRKQAALKNQQIKQEPPPNSTNGDDGANNTFNEQGNEESEVCAINLID